MAKLSATDTEQEYIYFVEHVMPPFARYIYFSLAS